MSQTGDPGSQTLQMPRGDEPGGRIGPFKLLQLLGEGGFGSVYEAEQEEPVRRRVALKVIKPGMDSREVIARFEAERQALALMDHPNIAHVFDAGTTESGRPYFVMELVKGEPISTYCRQHKLTIRQRLDLFEQVCEGIQHAHSKGIIHRDLKPSNVLVVEHGARPFAKVIDFGIAKATSGRLTDKTLFTEQFQMMGSPLYMSPEQAEGIANIDARTDIYSLGAILYELLTDTTPIESTSLRSASYAELQRVIRDSEPPSPSTRIARNAKTNSGIRSQTSDPGTTARIVRGELDWIAMKAIEKDRSRRYESAAALSMDVHRFLVGEPVQAAAPSAAYRLRRALSRHRVLLAAAAMVVLALAVGIFGTYSWSRRHPPSVETPVTSSIPEKSIAVLPFENLSPDKDNAYFASGMQDEILTRLAKIGALKVISRTSTQKYANHPENLKVVGEQLGVATILEGSIQKAGNAVHINVQLIRVADDAHLWAESYDRTLDNVFGVEGEVAQAVADALNAKLTLTEQRSVTAMPTQNKAAYDAYLRGLAYEAGTGDSYRFATEAYAQAVRLDPRFALAWAHLSASRSYQYFNGVDSADNTADAVKQAADTALRLQPELGEAWLAQGYYRYRVLKDFPGALQTFDEARKRLPNNTQVFVAFAFVLHRMGRWDEALSNMQQAVQLDPRNLNLLEVLASQFLGAMRRFEEARAVLDRALQIAPEDTDLMVSKAAVDMAEGRFDDAAKLLDPMPSDPKKMDVVQFKAYLSIAQGHFDAAIAQMRALLPKPTEPLTVDQATLANDMGYVQLHVGQSDDARATFARVLLIRNSIRSGVSDAFDRMWLASAYAGIGDKQDALEQAREAVEMAGNDQNLKPRTEVRLAQVQAWSGETEAAIAALPHLLTVPRGVMPGELLSDPQWDPLRKDPRFQKLIADIKAH